MTELKAGCKINLGLRITGRRPDGYHELDSLFWPLPEPCDTLVITGLNGGDELCLADCLTDIDMPDDDMPDDGTGDSWDETEPDTSALQDNKPSQEQGYEKCGDNICCNTGKAIPNRGIVVECNCPDVDINDNTLTRAWRLFHDRVRIVPRIHVRLEKNIPTGAGLGGGSSDAACLLKWLNSVVPLPLSEDSLADVALGVGADVPFFLQNKPCHVSGIGEKISQVEADLTGCFLLLACPGIGVDTTWAYKSLDQLTNWQKTGNNIDLPLHGCNLVQQSGKGKLHAQPTLYLSKWLAAGLQNDLEQAVFPHYPMLAELKRQILEHGADCACMSGSGSTVFGIFGLHHKNTMQNDAQAARQAAENAASNLLATVKQVFVLPL